MYPATFSKERRRDEGWPILRRRLLHQRQWSWRGGQWRASLWWDDVEGDYSRILSNNNERVEDMDHFGSFERRLCTCIVVMVTGWTLFEWCGRRRKRMQVSDSLWWWFCGWEHTSSSLRRYNSSLELVVFFQHVWMPPSFWPGSRMSLWDCAGENGMSLACALVLM